MSSFTKQTHHSESSSGDSKPQVIVRSGKTYLCSSCGTLVEIPEDVVGQLVIAVDPSPPEEPAEELPPQEETVSPEPPTPPQPERLKQREKVCFTGQMIDGLRVPSAAELDRAFSWVSFHLQVLDRQGSEIKRLRKLLKKRPKQPAHGPSSEACGKDPPKETSRESKCKVKTSHVDIEVDLPSDDIKRTAKKNNERGPP